MSCLCFWCLLTPCSCGEAQSALLLEIQARNREDAKRLIDSSAWNGVKLNPPTGPMSDMPLALATSTQGCSLPIVALLVESGADVNAVTDQNATPLLLASPSPSVMRYLLYYGADVNIQNADGRTALHEVIRKGTNADVRNEAIRLLLDYGADTTLKDKKGRTALDDAERAGVKFEGAVDLLQNYKPIKQPLGPSTSAAAFKREAALLEAIRAHDRKKATSVLDSGSVDLDKPFNQPLELACRLGFIDLVDLLVTRGADVNRRDATWMVTPLIAAAKHKQLDVLEYLLDHGADMNAQNIAGETALYHAVEAKFCRGGCMLVRRGADGTLKGPHPNDMSAKELARKRGYIPCSESSSGSSSGDSTNVSSRGSTTRGSTRGSTRKRHYSDSASVEEDYIMV